MSTKPKTLKIPVKQRTNSFSDPLEYKILSDEEVNLSKARAYDFLELETFPGERAVRESHVQFLYDEWVAGKFLWHNVTLQSGKLGDKYYRLNGQHTCWMRVNIPEKDEPVRAPIREIVYEVRDMENLRALYSAIDRNAPRTAGHIAKVLLMETRAGREIPPSYLRNLVAGFRIFFSEDWAHSHVKNINEMVGMIDKSYADIFNTVGRWFQIHYEDWKLIRRAAIIGAMFATFSKAVQASDDFWGPTVSGLNLTDKTDPRYQLRKFVEDHGHNTITGSPGNFVSQEDLYRICVHAWNKWRAGEKMERTMTLSKRPKAR